MFFFFNQDFLLELGSIYTATIQIGISSAVALEAMPRPCWMVAWLAWSVTCGHWALHCGVFQT